MIAWSIIDSFSGNFTDEKLSTKRPCPLCGSWSATTFFELDDFQFYTDSESEPKRICITQKQCSKCLAIYMSSGYTPYGFRVLFKESGASYGAPQWKYENRVAWLLKHISFSDQDIVMDLGCHLGKLLSMLPDGLRKIGVEVDRKIVSRAREIHPKITFLCDDLLNFQFNEKAKVITLFHVLEHLVDPVTVLQKLRGMADEKTILAIEVPVLENGNKVDINGYFSIHHLTHFSVASLRRCLRVSGWREVDFEPGSVQKGCRILAVANQPGEKEKAFQIADQFDDTLLYSYLAGYYRNLGKLHKKLEKMKNVTSCVLWGAGTHLELLYQLTPFFRQGIKMKCLIVDNDHLKQGQTWRGINIYSPEILKKIDWGKCFLIISSYGSQESIARSALRLGVPNSRLLKLYDDGTGINLTLND